MEELNGTLDPIVSPTQVTQWVGLSKPTIWRMRRANTFPVPLRLSPGRVGWRTSVIESWLREREESS